jgi:hypothetical protein
MPSTRMSPRVAQSERDGLIAGGRTTGRLEVSIVIRHLDLKTPTAVEHLLVTGRDEVGPDFLVTIIASGAGEVPCQF